MDVGGRTSGCRASSGGRFISRDCGARPMASWCRSTAPSIAGSRIAADPCSLLVFVDDATGRLMQLRFVRSESAFSYFEALELYLQAITARRCLLFRQAFGVPGGEEGCQGWPGHDPVRACALRAKHRDSLRKFEPGQGPRRADEPDAAGSAGQGTAAGRASATWRLAMRFCLASWSTTMRGLRLSLPDPMTCIGR